MLKKHKYLLSSFLLLFLVGCKDKNTNELNTSEIEPIIIADTNVEQKKDETKDEIKESEISELKFERSLEKDIMYYSIIDDVVIAINNHPSEEIDEYVSADIIQPGSFNETYEYYELTVQINLLENMDDSNFNESEKKLKNLAIEYKKKKSEIASYLNQYYNKQTGLVELPQSEYEKYDKMNDELNKILIDNKYLLLDTVEFYFKARPNYAYDDVAEMKMYLEDIDTSILNDVGGNIETTTSDITIDQLQNVLVNYPAFAVSYFYESLIQSILSKDQEGIEFSIESLQTAINQEKQNEEYKRLVSYKDYIDDLNAFINNKELLNLVNNHKHEELLYKIVYDREYTSSKYKSEEEEDSNITMLYQAYNRLK